MTIRDATSDDVALLARICAAGFESDPVMSWVFPDASTRLGQLTTAFAGLVNSFLMPNSVMHVVDDACATFWRTPAWERPPEEGGGESPWTPDVAERFRILDEGMRMAHPHEPHWYLNVVSTLPEQQGRGLGAAVLQPVLATCDAHGTPAYLESTNPRNLTLYRRQGFVDAGEIALPGGPSMTAMWRDPIS